MESSSSLKALVEGAIAVGSALSSQECSSVLRRLDQHEGTFRRLLEYEVGGCVGAWVSACQAGRVPACVRCPHSPSFAKAFHLGKGTY